MVTDTIYIFLGILVLGLKLNGRRARFTFSRNLALYFSTAFTYKTPHTVEQTLVHPSLQNSLATGGSNKLVYSYPRKH